MKLRKDKKKPDRFWFGRNKFQWVDLGWEITKIKNDTIFTLGGIFKVLPDFPPYYVKVERFYPNA